MKCCPTTSHANLTARTPGSHGVAQGRAAAGNLDSNPSGTRSRYPQRFGTRPASLNQQDLGSGRQDSNLRSPASKAGAFAKLSYTLRRPCFASGPRTERACRGTVPRRREAMAASRERSSSGFRALRPPHSGRLRRDEPLERKGRARRGELTEQCQARDLPSTAFLSKT